MPEYDIVIREGTIVDGTRLPKYAGDVAIKDGRIARMGRLKGATASRVLDASGAIVAPGFVDLHTHYDAQIHWDPYCSLSGWHGVTTVAIGNCGFGFAPCPANDKDRDRLMMALSRNESIPYEAMQLGMHWDWTTFPQFLDVLDRRIPKGINIASYVPLSPIYAWVMGYEESKMRRPTEAELKEMCRLVADGMEAGATGWSAQVLGPDFGNQRDYDASPMITDLMTDTEILSFAQVLGERGEGNIELTYRGTGEEPRMVDKDQKMMYEKVAEVSGRPVLYQLVVTHANNPKIHRGKLRWLEQCARRGVPLYGQGLTHRTEFEFTFKDWNLFDGSPNWRELTVGTVAQRKAKMQDAEIRARLRAETDTGFVAGPVQVPAMMVMEVGDPKLDGYLGQTVGDISAKEGKHPVDVLLDLVVADELRTEFLGPTGRDSTAYTAEVINHPLTVAGVSDGGAHIKFATFGAYPTGILTWLVRDSGRVSIEEAHYKLSYMAAFVGGIRDRGFLREGAPADIVVYDLEKLALNPPEVVHDLPGGDWRRVQKAEGYRWTMVNGEITQEHGEPTGTLSGKLLRHGVA